ncbi:MAG: hypothetical protein IIX99_01700 [Oscillospiraceae bacterium]|nr:hypothetical protein [Oscillospiraceae bacterium]
MEKQVFLQELPSYHSGEDYKCLLQDSLNEIAKHVERDLDRSEKENNDVALFSQSDRVISSYETHIRFSKTI